MSWLCLLNVVLNVRVKRTCHVNHIKRGEVNSGLLSTDIQFIGGIETELDEVDVGPEIGKAPGTRKYSKIWILRDFVFAVSKPTCHFFNSSIQSGLVSRICAMANAVKLPKSHPPTSIQ